MKRLPTLLGLLAASIVAAQTPPQSPPPHSTVAPSPALTRRIGELVPLLGGGGDPAATFDAAFRAHVPGAELRRIARGLAATLGPPVDVAGVDPVTPDAGHVRIRYRHGSAALDIAVGAAAPHRIAGLRITGTATDEPSLAAIAGTLAALPGSAGFAVARLGDAAPEMLSSLSPDRAFAVGSAFKLAILAELIRATNAGERRWDDSITLDGAPLPGGAYAGQPAGTRLTIRELAGRMIAASDNSAADILLAALGREKVEAILPVIGWHNAALDQPLLSTLELFKLKTVAGGALGRRWLALDAAGRRALLAGDVAAAPLSAIDPLAFQRGTPIAIDGIEWFASPLDLVRTMDWIRRNTDGPAGGDARAILALNPGIGPAGAARWRYVGYKGGSEPGVIDMTLLLQRADGGWYALSASWNDPAHPVDEPRLVAIVTRAVELATP